MRYRLRKRWRVSGARSQFRGAEDHFNKFEPHAIFNEPNCTREPLQLLVDGNNHILEKGKKGTVNLNVKDIKCKYYTKA